MAEQPVRETQVPAVGFVGIGNMGAPMVRCLARAGFEVAIYDRRRQALKPLATEPGITFAANLTDLGRKAAVVITMLPDSAAVRQAVLGGEDGAGLVEGLAPDSVVVDMSSSFPLATRKLGGELATRQIGLVDAPVSGGVPKAVSGTLAIMAGGDEATISRIDPILAAMGTVHRSGPLGSGHAMKALNNYVSAAGLIATCEALVVARKFGLDGAILTRILNASTGRNNTTENKAERFLLSRTFDSGFALALMRKDVGMAKQLASELGVPAPELAFTSELLDCALERLGRDADHTAVLQYIEQLRHAD